MKLPILFVTLFLALFFLYFYNKSSENYEDIRVPNKNIIISTSNTRIFPKAKVETNKKLLDNPLQRTGEITLNKDEFKLFRSLVSEEKFSRCPIDIVLFDNVKYSAFLSEGKIDDNGILSLSGKIDGQPFSLVVFVMSTNDTITGAVYDHEKNYRYEISCGENGKHIIEELDMNITDKYPSRR